MIDNYFPKFDMALSAEIQAIREGGGSKCVLSDGRFSGIRDSEINLQYLYIFSADQELNFPDDTKADLKYKNKKYEAIVVSVSEFSVLIALSQKIDDRLDSAVLYTQPWFLLEKLQERLKDISNDVNKKVIGEYLLTKADDKALMPAVDHASSLLNAVARHLGEELLFNKYQLSAIGHILL